MKRKLPPNLGLKVAAVWLILTGLVGLLHLSFAGLGTILAVLALVAGVLILINR